MGHERTSGTFGSRLRATRERRGISLRQIAAATKISVAVLEALERNDLTRLPGGIFSRAFVRSYAVEVGLDPDKTIQEFLDEFPQETAPRHTGTVVDDGEAFENERRMASTFLGLLAVSVPIAGAVLYFGTAGRRTGSPPMPIPQPVAVSSPSESQPAPTQAADSPAAKEPIAPPPRPAAPAAPPEATTAPLETQPGFTVALSVTRECWISAIVDGERTLARVLQPGDPHTLEVRREMVLTAGDAAAVVLTLNGAEAKPLGKPGEVVTTRLNVSNFKGFLASP